MHKWLAKIQLLIAVLTLQCSARGDNSIRMIEVDDSTKTIRLVDCDISNNRCRQGNKMALPKVIDEILSAHATKEKNTFIFDARSRDGSISWWALDANNKNILPLNMPADFSHISIANHQNELIGYLGSGLNAAVYNISFSAVKSNLVVAKRNGGMPKSYYYYAINILSQMKKQKREFLTGREIASIQAETTFGYTGGAWGGAIDADRRSFIYRRSFSEQHTVFNLVTMRGEQLIRIPERLDIIAVRLKSGSPLFLTADGVYQWSKLSGLRQLFKGKAVFID